MEKSLSCETHKTSVVNGLGTYVCKPHVKEVPVRDSFSTMLIQTTEHCKLRVWEPLKKGKEPFTHEKLAPNAETTISKSLLRLCCKLIIECERNSVSLLTFDSDINIFSNFQAL